MTGLQRAKGLNPGCGQEWFPTLEAAQGRVDKVASLALPGAAPVVPVPCYHSWRGGGFHLAEVTPARPPGVASPAPGAARLPGGFPPRVRGWIRTRAGNGDPREAVCEMCGRPIGETGGEMQHRDNRGMGGSRDPVINGPSNGALLCGHAWPPAGCHGLCTVTGVALAHDLGFVLKHGEDPRVTPVTLYGLAGGTRQVYLTAGPYLGQRPLLEAA